MNKELYAIKKWETVSLLITGIVVILVGYDFRLPDNILMVGAFTAVFVLLHDYWLAYLLPRLGKEKTALKNAIAYLVMGGVLAAAINTVTTVSSITIGILLAVTVSAGMGLWILNKRIITTVKERNQ